VQYQLNVQAVAQRLGNELVIVHPATDRIFVLNRTAARIWELLSEHHELDLVEQILIQEFDVEPAQLGKELHALIASLVEEKFLSVAGS
jgi:hypothetical protein